MRPATPLLLSLLTLRLIAAEVSTGIKNYEPVLENAEVRVGRVTVAPGESEGLHRHPYPRVLICVQPGTIEVHRQDHSVDRVVYHRGDVRYQANTDPHEPVNAGKERFKGVVVEFKGPAPAAAHTPPDPLDPVVVAGQFHKAVVENERIRVLEVRVKPGEFEPMHRHRRSVLVILDGGTAQFGIPDGSTKDVSFSGDPKPGEPPAVFWEDAATHSVRNIGKTAIRLIRVELK